MKSCEKIGGYEIRVRNDLKTIKGAMQMTTVSMDDVMDAVADEHKKVSATKPRKRKDRRSNSSFVMGFLGAMCAIGVLMVAAAAFTTEVYRFEKGDAFACTTITDYCVVYSESSGFETMSGIGAVGLRGFAAIAPNVHQVW